MAEKMFSNCRIFILPDGLLQKRIQLFEKQISKYGGVVTTDIGECSPTHIVVEDDILGNPVRIESALKSFQKLNQSSNYEIIGLRWLCCCLKEKKLLNTDPFIFRHGVDLDLQDDRALENDEKSPPPVKKSRVDSPSLIDAGIDNDSNFSPDVCGSNDVIINEFQKLADAYRSRGDRWRSVAYDKAISSLKSYNEEITGVNQLKSLPHLSSKMMNIISEIIENGFSSKAQNVCNDEKTQVLNMFTKIWGSGTVTAQSWYQKGLRTLKDVELDGNLTQSQKIGFKYYNEIQESIPRQEVEQIMQVVKVAALLLEPSVQFVPCGSYRRGKKSSGDVDVLLIVNNSIDYRSLIPKIIRKLRQDEFLIDDLVGTTSSSCAKYLGLCKLKGESKKIRRLDIFAVSENYSACALMHYTGSEWFNRGIRTLAAKMNMHLSETSLRMNGPDGKILPTPTEESIFKYLGLPYRPPEKRHFF